MWLRFTMGIIILGIAVAVRKQFALPNKSEWGYFALLGFLAITFHQWLKSNALQTSEASTTSWIVATTPVFMALLGWVILKEKLALAKIIGIVLAAVVSYWSYPMEILHPVQSADLGHQEIFLSSSVH